MERGSLVGGLWLMLECLFSIFKVYDKDSLFEFHWSVSLNSLSILLCLFWKVSLEELALSSRSFALAFDDAIPYP